LSERKKIIGAIEIGTSKVAVLVGEVIGDRTLNIIGMGHSSARGVIKGDVVDAREASDCAHAAILAAEKSAGVRIEGVYLAQTGGHLDGFYSDGAVNVSASDNRVDAADIELVTSIAKAKELPNDRLVVHYIRQPYRLDGRVVPEPEYLVGKRLEVGYWIAHGLSSKVSDKVHIVNGMNLYVDDVILSSLASGTIVTSREEREQGTLVIDIGRGTSDFALYREGHCCYSGCLPVGGDHITNDLSLGLRITASQAESLKLRHGRGVQQCRDRAEKVWLVGDCSIGDRQFPLAVVEQIISLRVHELFEVIRRRLEGRLRPELVAGGVVLTGGCSKLPAIEQAAAKIFGLPARVSDNSGWAREDLKEPEYSTVLGLLYYGLANQREQRPRRGLFSALRNMFAIS
jgi:cell division protein FtsA